MCGRGYVMFSTQTQHSQLKVEQENTSQFQADYAGWQDSGGRVTLHNVTDGQVALPHLHNLDHQGALPDLYNLHHHGALPDLYNLHHQGALSNLYNLDH